MYELEYVKKRKRRKLVVIIGGISVATISVFSIVAFLGKSVGTFTVSLETANVKLSLSTTSDFAEPTSYLRANGLTSFQEYTYSDFETIGDDRIDNEQTDYKLGANYNKEGEVRSLNFFKYTFFLKNTGDIPCKYRFSLNILDRSSANEGSLDDTLRISLYENDLTSTEHNKTVYGKKSTVPHYDEDGNPDFRAPISVSKEEATAANPFMGYAEMFANNNVVTTFERERFNVNEAKRYTVVIWLEGFRSSNLDEAPKGAKLNLGINIDAYEI